MKHAAIIEQRRRREPAFELPPSFDGADDRRLAGRATAIWREHCYGGVVPDAGACGRALRIGSAFAANMVLLDWASGTVAVEEIGAAVGGAFGLGAGPLAAGEPFARALGDACTDCAATGAPARFEGGFARDAGAAPTLLTRGVVLPLANSGRIVAACAVIAWKEILSPLASDGLRRELWQALAGAVPRAGTIARARPIWH